MWPFRKKQEVELPPKPKWKPTIPVNHEQIIERFSYYSNGKIPFVVFEYGTCVPVDSTSTNMEQDALAILHDLFNQHADFNPMPMDDGNWMVSMSGGAYSVCLIDEIKNHWSYLEQNHLEGLAAHEVFLNENQEANQFDERGIIGLFGRARWFMDAEAPSVYKTILATKTKEP